MHYSDFGYERCPYIERYLWRMTLWIALILCAVAALSGCAGRSALPPAAPPAVKVLVPVTKACEVAKVEPSPLETSNGVPGDIYEAVKQVVADVLTLRADRENLVAANTDPCPGVKP